MSVIDRRLTNLRKVTKGNGAYNDEFKEMCLATVPDVSGSHNDMIKQWLEVRAESNTGLSISDLKSFYAKQNGASNWNSFDMGAIPMRLFPFKTDIRSKITFEGSQGHSAFNENGLMIKGFNFFRLDHKFEGGVWVNKGLLVEEARTNLILRSESAAAPWTSIGTPVINATSAIAPDGALTVVSVRDDTGAGFEGRTQTITIPNDSLPYTYSVFMPKTIDSPTKAEYQLRMTGGTTPTRLNVQVDTLNGTVFKRASAAAATARMDDFGDFWRLVISEKNNGTGNTACRIDIFSAVVGNAFSNSILGNFTGFAVGWGHQIEQGAFATSYLPTFANTVDRTRDEVSVENFDEQGFNIEEGTIFLEWDQIQPNTGVAGFAFIASLNDGTNTNSIEIYVETATGRVVCRSIVGGIEQGNISPIAVMNDNELNSIAIAYVGNDVTLSLKGQSVEVGTFTAMPTGITTANLGSSAGFANSLNGHLVTFDYYNFNRPGNELITMTAPTV